MAHIDMIGFWRKSIGETDVAPMTSEDLQQCADIHAASFKEAWGDGTLHSMLKAKNMHGLVAKTGRQRKNAPRPIAGFLLYSIAASEAEIITIATHPKFRKSGIARAMVDELIRLSLADRLSEIFLEVDETNASALALYRKKGFKKVGERIGYYSEGERAPKAKDKAKAGNALIMRLNLLD